MCFPFRMLDFSFPSVLIADLYVVKYIFLENSLFFLICGYRKRVNVEPWCVFQYVSYFRLVHSSVFNFPLTQTLILRLKIFIIFFLCFHNFLKHTSKLTFYYPIFIASVPLETLINHWLHYSALCSLFKKNSFSDLGLLYFWCSHLWGKRKPNSLIITSGKMETISKRPFKYVVLLFQLFQCYSFSWGFKIYFSVYITVDLKSMVL